VSEHLLFPKLPYDMKPRAKSASSDVQLLQFVGSATESKFQGRIDSCARAFGDNYDDVRRHASELKQHVIDNLDAHLATFVDSAEANGARVHFAVDADAANAIALSIAKKHDAKLCVKSKSMLTEETHLLPVLEGGGIKTIETDLGEFIVQLDDDAPSHIVSPMIHKDRRSVARAFDRELGAEYTEVPEDLTMIARDYLRQKYREAEIGVSGANFLVADTGAAVVCTNEGNADLCMATPNVHIVMAGIEKVVARMEHMGVFLKLLARSATAQDLTCYTSFVHGPRRTADSDGPEEVHIILVDNGRTGVLARDSRELLKCIRCGACLNACPIFRSVGGGHAYGAVYSGPIGAVLTPHLKGLQGYPDLPQASSLCGACKQACPVNIDIPAHLVRLRKELAAQKSGGVAKRTAYRLWAMSLRSPVLYRLGLKMNRFVLRRAGRARRGGGGLTDRGWIASTNNPLLRPLQAWVEERDMPTPPSMTFRDARNAGGGGGDA
jgi:L-lactate dehydrogenase complex protein LldF